MNKNKTVNTELNFDKENKLYKDIQEIIENEKFKNCKVSFNKLPVDGGNYLAELYTVDIKGETRNGEKEINLFIKKKISIESSDLDISEAYKRENFVYSDLFKVFGDLQDEAKIPRAERYTNALYYESTNPSVVIMDNLVKRGYKMYDRTKCISLEYAKGALMQLAKFHALSFAMEKQRPQYYNNVIKKIKNFAESNIKLLCENSIPGSLEGVEPELKTRAEKVLYKLSENLTQCFDPQDKVCCLCHGDFRVSNMMLREQDKNSLEIIPLDFQTAYYGPPLNDFFYFVLGSTDQHFRRQYMDYLKMYYRQQMQEYLSYFDINLEAVYPKDTFNADYDKIRLTFGLPITFLLLPFNLSSFDFPDFTKDKISDIKFVINDNLKTRIREILEDFVEWGYL